MPTFVLQLHHVHAAPQRALRGAVAPQAERGVATLDLALGRERLECAATGDHVASTIRDLCAAATSIADGSAPKALVPLYDAPWELCLVAGDDCLELSLYRTGALPEVRVLDEAVSLPELYAQLRGAVEALGLSADDARLDELSAHLERLASVSRARITAADKGSSTLVRWRSRPRVAADGSGAASILAVSMSALLPTRPAGRPEPAQADLHALLARGRVSFEVRGRRVELGAGFVFLQFERLVALCRPLLDARAARRGYSVRAQIAGAVLGLRLTHDDALALTITRAGEGTVTIPALDARAFVSPVAEGALALTAAAVRCDRGLAKNLRLKALRTEARALRRWLLDLDRVDTKVNADPSRYRAVVAEPEAPSALDLRGATRLRYTERWRAEVEGLDLGGVFVVGERVIVPGARELSAIDRTSGEVAWSSPATRAATLAAGDDILRVSARGDVELRCAESGESLWATRIVPRVGPASPPVVFAQPGVARVALLTESERRLVALDLRTGEARWTLSARHSGSFRLRRVGRLVVAVSGDSVVTAVDLTSGEVVWRHGDGLPFSIAPLVHGETVVALAGEPGRGPAVAHVVGGLTGVQHHVLSTGLPACAPPVASGDVVAIPCASRDEGVVLVGFSLLDGAEVFRAVIDPVSSGASRPAVVAAEGLFIANLPSGRAVAVEADTGAVRWTWSGRAARAEDVPRRLDPVLRAGAMFLPQSPLQVLRPSDGVTLTEVSACSLVPDLVRVDEAGSVYVGEESGHLACFELGARLRVLRPV
ncbi:MAG: PQQ-binding-like beta-propeller repeat protein [Polyangiales bacterium]